MDVSGTPKADQVKFGKCTELFGADWLHLAPAMQSPWNLLLQYVHTLAMEHPVLSQRQQWCNCRDVHDTYLI